jgi:hypothetical protein
VLSLLAQLETLSSLLLHPLLLTDAIHSLVQEDLLLEYLLLALLSNAVVEVIIESSCLGEQCCLVVEFGQLLLLPPLLCLQLALELFKPLLLADEFRDSLLLPGRLYLLPSLPRLVLLPSVLCKPLLSLIWLLLPQ